ncbi:hypothetical protein [Sphingomonas montanisoli]|uniref:Uncharacterized protein n=1 Tax=Sphingomonas montanisoli TaxID=2606412 RepID=A0A5D9BWY7_9SPHN|nr:hypothetical protein [Sphingomonas montanisoli]TZG23886.1 hypothetical protein FYJ91_20445 [Sphingomonas montanisoli]
MDKNSAVAKPAASKPAAIPPATTINPSGAPDQIVPDVDLDHPAVDADPRANTTVDQNRIDFNDPTIPGDVAVARNLGMTEGEDEKKD